MKLLKDLLAEDNEHPISDGELRHVEKYLQHVWDHLGIKFEFTKHFFERVNDSRNGKQITANELVKIFTETYKKYGKMIAGKVTPDTEKTFDSVLTDISTKVNSPVVVVWNSKKRELEMIAKTVMRVNHFYTHPDQPRLTVQHYEPEGKVITENEMKQKTYRDLVEWVGWNTPEVAPIAAPQAVDDVDSAAFSVEKPEILEKLNAYCHEIANHQYINPYYPLNALWRKLMLIGVQFDLKKIMLVGDQGKAEVPVLQFGGRFGTLGDPSSFVSQDDGTRVPGGLNLVVTWQKTGGVYSLDVQIHQGIVPGAIGFGEEVVAEAVEEPIHKQYKYQGKTKNGILVFKHPEGHQFHVQDMPAMAGRKADIQWGHRGAGSEATTQGFGYPGLQKHLKKFHGDKKVTESEHFDKTIADLKHRTIVGVKQCPDCKKRAFHKENCPSLKKK